MENCNGRQCEVAEGTLFFLTPLTIHGFANLTDVEDMILQFSPGFLLANATTANPNTILKLTSEQTPYMQIPQNSPLEKVLTELYGLCHDVTQIQQQDME